MIIVHVIADLTTGGAEMMIKRLIEAHLGNPQFRHHVISLRGLGRIGAELESIGVDVQALGMRGIGDIPRILIRLARDFRRLRADIVHAWMYHANLLAGLAARLSGGRPVIWGIRATAFDQTMGVSRATTWLRRLSEPLSGRLASAIVYVAHAARTAHERLGYDRRLGLVIPNGYGPPTRHSRKEARGRFDIGERSLVIGSVGRLNAAKDPRTFVQAAALVAKDYTHARFLMVGRGVDSSAELRSWINDAGVGDRFVLSAEIDDVYACLAAMDVFCLHSVTEAFPNILAEAMNAGLPCVATDVGDAARILGKCGTIVPPRDPRALAAALGEMIDAATERRRRLGEQGRERIASIYSLPLVVNRYERLYHDLGNGMSVRRIGTE